jgi:NAD(P)-dependent dehydrogenase (short-subunit alcohol dehydrogenase family)
MTVADSEIRFDGRAIIVTGAGRGLGRSYALLLASRGAKVLVVDNGSAMDGSDPAIGPADSVVEEIRANGGNAAAFTADISTETGSIQLVESCLDAFGRIDGLLHNASTLPDLVSIENLSSRDLDQVMRVNPFAALWITRAAWPHMLKQHYGRIVYTTSTGVYGNLGNAPYAAAKAATISLMRCVAVEGAGKNIIVNAISPASRSRMTERFHGSAYADWFLSTMAPEKVAVAAAYLMSEECETYGEIFAVGGGRIARITIAETEGVIGNGESIEEVRDAMSQVLTDTSFFYPKDFAERSVKIAALFGFDGGLESSSGYAMAPVEKTKQSPGRE